MPVFDISYTKQNDANKKVRKDILVFSADLDAALNRFEQRHPTATVESVALVGSIILPKKESNGSDEPCWTSRNGSTKPISKIKSGNLRAVARRLRTAGLGDTGIAKAIAVELASR